MMTTMTTSMTTPTTTVSTSRAVPSTGPLAPTSGSLNAEYPATTSFTELNDVVGLFTRVDRKYLVPLERVQELVGGFSSEARVLETDGRYCSSCAPTYFDTPGLEVFMFMARKWRRRFKAHTCTYLDSGLCFLEVKTRGARGVTVKWRMGYHPDGAPRLTGSGRAFVVACLASAGATGPAAARDVAAALRPVLVTIYERTTLHLPRAEARAIIDAALIWQRLTPGGHVRATAVAGVPQALCPAYPTAVIDDGEPVVMVGVAVVETKNLAMSSPAGRALWDAGHRPIRISRYVIGIALLHPELPANRWCRILTHELADLLGTNRSNLESIGATRANASAV